MFPKCLAEVIKQNIKMMNLFTENGNKKGKEEG